MIFDMIKCHDKKNIMGKFCKEDSLSNYKKKQDVIDNIYGPYLWVSY